MGWLWSSAEVTSRAVRVLAAFGAVVAALTLTVGTLLSGTSLANYGANLLLSDPRHQLLTLLFLSLGSALVLAVALLWTRKESGLEAMGWWARAAAPAVVLPFVLVLLHRGFGTEVEGALLLGLLVLALERLMRVSLAAFSERPPAPFPGQAALQRVSHAFFSNDRAVFGVVLLATAVHAVFLSTWAVWAHQRFATYGFDLGQYHQLFETTLHGRWLAAPAMGHPETFGDLNCSHSDFVIFALLPFYALHPSAETVLVIQAVLVALGAIPTYLFARHFVPVRWAFLLGLAWLLYPPMAAGQLYDFHTQPIGAAFAIWAVWALAAKRNVAYWCFFVLALSAREDVPMGLAMLGVFLIVTGRRIWLGLATAAIATLYFGVMRFAVMPNTFFSESYGELAAPGENGFGAILQTLLTNPGYALKTFLNVEKLRYAFQIFAPLAFLPLRRPVFGVLLVAPVMLTLMTDQVSPMILMTYQYVFNWVPWVFPLCALALSLYGTTEDGLRKGRAALVALVVGTLLANLQWGAYSPAKSIVGGRSPVPLQAPSQADLEREAVVQRFLETVPADASLCASDRLQAHVTTHVDTWSLKTGVHDCAYLLWSDLPGDFGGEHARTAMIEHKYVRVSADHGVQLAKKAVGP